MNQNEQYKSLLVMVVGFAILSLLTHTPWLLWLAIGIGVLALLSETLRGLILKVWFKIAEVLGYINSRILLSVVFYGILFPIALLSKLGRKNPLGLKRPEGTVYQERNHQYSAKDFEKMW